jgi:hypothetical protein
MKIRKLVSWAEMRAVSIENSETKLMQSPIVVTHIIISMKISGKASQFSVKDCPKQMKSMMKSAKPIAKSTNPTSIFDSGMHILGK